MLATYAGYSTIVIESFTANVINLRTFALIVSVHPHCARNPLRDVMPRHALSARAVEEMWRYLTIILRNRAEYHLILSRRGRRPSWLNQGIFRKIEQDNCLLFNKFPSPTIFRTRKTTAL